MKNQKNVPELRFPEFVENWQSQKLKNILIESNVLASEEFPLYSLTIESGIVPKTERYERSFLVKNEEEAYKVVLPNDFAYNPMNLRFGALSRHTESKTVKVSKYYNIFSVNLKANIIFVDYLLTKSSSIRFYDSIAMGSLVEKKRVHFSDFLNCKFLLPSITEQQQIASFLSAVDKKLTQLRRKKELLETYKRGLMQKLFSQQIRFKQDDGSAFPDWQEKKLGNVAAITMGQSPDSQSYNNDGIGMYLVQGNADISNRLTKPKQWTTNPTKICENGDLILTVRAPIGMIAKSNVDACIGRGVCSLKNLANTNKEFIYQFLLHYEPQWITLGQGSTFTAINATDIKSLKFSIPSIKEQQKIANCLTALDKKIEAVAQQIHHTEQFKKGLLQKMFV